MNKLRLKLKKNNSAKRQIYILLKLSSVNFNSFKLLDSYLQFQQLQQCLVCP